ncbi:twin-arginine translocase TatA/TatE family subunit [Sinomonas humi]|uniref:Sec-independent protein translocase protein TatA n=1 Tax=Sinomonas humi TaxID=1338436 RepID=A0A0B2ALU0_9MICC|nr:twin-arginine translocase TatA/TatE family subunit [Sinomonas humi]KHL04326.1 hypothetical protein LK10_05140 [Sinomonas humi]
MARLFEEPWVIGILILAALLLFGAPKLPGIARSVGQSLRVFKTEVKQFKEEASTADFTAAPKTPEAQD